MLKRNTSVMKNSLMRAAVEMKQIKTIRIPCKKMMRPLAMRTHHQYTHHQHTHHQYAHYHYAHHHYALFIQLEAVISQTLVGGHGGEGQGIEVEVNDETEGEEELSVVEGYGLLGGLPITTTLVVHVGMLGGTIAAKGHL